MNGKGQGLGLGGTGALLRVLGEGPEAVKAELARLTSASEIAKTEASKAATERAGLKSAERTLADGLAKLKLWQAKLEADQESLAKAQRAQGEAERAWQRVKEAEAKVQQVGKTALEQAAAQLKTGQDRLKKDQGQVIKDQEQLGKDRAKLELDLSSFATLRAETEAGWEAKQALLDRAAALFARPATAA